MKELFHNENIEGLRRSGQLETPVFTDLKQLTKALKAHEVNHIWDSPECINYSGKREKEGGQK